MLPLLLRPMNTPIQGTDLNDSLVGGTGNDTILALDGSDTVVGGDGNDVISLDKGNDFYGTASLYGAPVIERGNDSISGGVGNDRIVDWSGANTLQGDDGQDTLDGSSYDHAWDLSADLLSGGTTHDILVGDYGDTLTGGLDKSDDFFIYGGGQPVVITDARSEAQAGVGADEIFLLVPDDLNFDIGAWVGFGAQGKDATLDLGNTILARFTGEAGQNLNFTVQETSTTIKPPGWGSDADDTLKGTGGGDLIAGGGGNDSITATSGADFVNDGWGNDYVSLGDGADFFVGADSTAFVADNDDIHGGRGSDWVTAWTGADIVHGDDGADRIDVDDLPGQTGASDDIVSGGRGDDTISADGADTISGDGGQDLFLMGPDAAGVYVKDFTAGQDSLQVYALGGPMTVETAANGTDVWVNVGGILVATLRGVDLADLTIGDHLIG